MGRTPSPGRRRDERRDRERVERERPDRERPDRERRERERPVRHKSRSRSRSRDRRRRSPERRRSASPTGRRRRSRSQSPGPSTARPKRSNVHERPAVTQADLEGKSPEEQEMLRIMGFCGFDTTKGKKVDENDVGEVHVVLKRKYRQYMNRKGGFNRPLDFVA